MPRYKVQRCITIQHNTTQHNTTQHNTKVSVSAVTGLVTALVCDTGLRTPSLALKLLRIFARMVCNRSTNFGVSRTFHSRLIGQHLPIRRVTWPCDFDLWPWRSLRLSLMRVFVLRLYALPVSALVGLVTLTFDLESGAHYCSWDGQSSYQFWSS